MAITPETCTSDVSLRGYHDTGLEEALKRKDAIIRVRNAQISALWDELHTRQPWTNALSGDAPINLASEAAVNASRKLLVIGINTVSPPLAKLNVVPSSVEADQDCRCCIAVLAIPTLARTIRALQ